jgi:hypothetical protein
MKVSFSRKKIKENHPKIWRTLRSTFKLTKGVLGLRKNGAYTYYEELDTIFISVSKNANTTINRMFFDKLDLPYDPDNYHTIHQYKSEHLNLNQEEFLNMDKKDIFVFAFSRNPLTRLISCYENKIVEENFWNIMQNYYGIFYPEMPFEEFAKKVCKIPDWWSDGHFQSQTVLIYSENKDVTDYVGTVENFTKDIRPVIERFNLPEPDTSNRTKSGSRSIQDYYTKQLADKVYNRYQKDFELLDYQKIFKKIRNKL